MSKWIAEQGPEMTGMGKRLKVIIASKDRNCGGLGSRKIEVISEKQ